MKKMLLQLTIVFTTLFTLTGCGNKEALSVSSFSSKAEANGYDIYDVTSQFESYNTVESATVAQSSDGWQVEFYILTDEDSATDMFDTNQSNFESYVESSYTNSSSDIGNYSTYSLTSGGYYMYLCRVDNTLLYVMVEDTYKDTVKEFIDELGY